MSKKTKLVEIEGIGPVTLSALGCGWMEEHGDTMAAKAAEGTIKAGIAANLLVVHASIQKKHPEITVDTLKETLIISEVNDLASQVIALSGLSAPGGATPESPSQGSSSAS
jgi:hypothetical protein